MDKNSNVPEIRFKGFDTEWEQRKLGELAEIKDSARIPNSEWNESGIPYIRASDISNEDLNGVLFISPKRYEFYRARTGAPVRGDVLFNGGGEIGKALLNDDEKPIYVQGGAVLYVRTSISETLDGQFLKTYFETPNAKTYIDVASAGGTMKHFTLKPSIEMPVTIPSIHEQIKIGNYFKNIDNLITLHQRKIECLKNAKKAMLTKLFPKEGELVPEVRFKGFTDDWEQRKFATVFEGLQNNTLSRAELSYESGTVKNVHYGDVLIKFGDYIDVSETELPYISDDTKAEKFKSSFLQNGDIVIADTAEDDTVGKCTEIQGAEGLKLLSGLHTIACRPKMKYGPKFLGYCINSSAYHDQLKPLMQGIKVTSISKSALQGTDIMVPKSIEEQCKIGEYLSNLDNLITLHQRKYEKLIDCKKAFLNKMFGGES